MSNEVSCNEKDKQALLSLKRGLIDPFNLLSSWSSQEDCCRWDGVHCDNKTSRVTELHLAYTGIGGEISRSLLKLEFLNYLDLSFNDFNHTPIPTFLGSMDNLYWMSGLFSIQYIDLSSVDLHKEADWLQIMSKFSSLSELYLSNCKLDSLNPSLGFVNFTSLQVLYLSGNHFNHEIPNWFSNLKKLEYLSLYPNHLIGKIPESLGQLKHLTYLNLSFNSLNGPIPLSVGNLSHMRTLSLNQNQLNGTIPKSLGLLSNLEELYIQNNFLTGTINEGHFKKLSKLKDLSMSQTQLFFNVNSNWVPPFQLEYVSMSSIKIGPNFPSWLQSQRSLGFLDMSTSGISSKAPSWFWNWTSNVEAIDLSDNHIEGDLSNIFLNSTAINLRSNHFKGRFPLLSENVKVLNIANNSYSGPISTFLCQKVIRKYKLVVLDASNNLLSGELSHWSNSLTVNLQSLRLQNNNISGDIPSSFKNCSNFGLIDIGNNHLTGIIPPWIGEMTNLLVLRLRSNEFKGHIPPQICQLSSLRVLDLADNSLFGVIPNCLKNISAMALPEPNIQVFPFEPLKYMYGYVSYIENLKLVPKGKELEYARNLEFVEIIDLSNNNLSGSIPAEICVLFELRFLNLSRNHLMGKIPEKIGSMKELESIDLSRNHLSGIIPPSVSNLTFLSYLDLSYKNFYGRIPSSTQLQSFDALSYVGNPQLCGDPLPKNCTIEEESLKRSPTGSAEDDSINSSFYLGMGVGFAAGFWAICGALFFNRTWRHSCFRFSDDIRDWIYVNTVIKLNWLLKS
ncbi:hypothetical protein ACB098_05G024700 [Castanea mollissima]